MRILVTGAAGFVGSEVVRSLLADGRQVTAVDRDPDFPRRVGATLPRVRAVTLDLDDRERVAVFLKETQPEGLVHLAWYANPADYLVGRANFDSLSATITLVEAALAAGCRKFVLAGSGVEYAIQNRPLLETDPADPRTLYAACKLAAWAITRVLAQTVGAELAWARIFHIHGPGERADRLLPWVARQLRAGSAVPLTDGKQVRDHLHVSDVAAGLTALLLPGVEGIYNVCSGEPVTLRRVLETLGELVGRSELLHFGEVPHRSNETMFLGGDSTRLRALGWAPRFGLRDGLADALGGYF